MIEIAARKKPQEAHPWPELSEHTVDAIVAKAIRGSRAEARELPLLTFYEVLMDAQAQAEAYPKRLEHEEAERERIAKEKKQAKPGSG